MGGNECVRSTSPCESTCAEQEAQREMFVFIGATFALEAFFKRERKHDTDPGHRRMSLDQHPCLKPQTRLEPQVGPTQYTTDATECWTYSDDSNAAPHASCL
ncbi:hypothetical protein MN608_02047 [Microdochium nivale]|nr:hypothetical protein MN608_02047 [Microdochium nivale]